MLSLRKREAWWDILLVPFIHSFICYDSRLFSTFHLFVCVLSVLLSKNWIHTLLIVQSVLLNPGSLFGGLCLHQSPVSQYNYEINLFHSNKNNETLRPNTWSHKDWHIWSETSVWFPINLKLWNAAPGTLEWEQGPTNTSVNSGLVTMWRQVGINIKGPATEVKPTARNHVLLPPCPCESITWTPPRFWYFRNLCVQTG